MNWGKRILSATLAAVMSLSLAISPLPGMMADYEGEKVEAADSENTATISLPITIRDLHDSPLIYSAGSGDTHKDLSVPLFSSTRKITVDNKVYRVPDYVTTKDGAHVKRIAAMLESSDINKNESNTFLKKLYTKLKEVKGSITDDAWNNPSTYDTSSKSLDQVENSYEAAIWLLDHLFIDGSFTLNENTVEYSKTYPNYEKLVLNHRTTGMTEKGQGLPCFGYNSCANGDQSISTEAEHAGIKTLFDTTNKLIKNDATNGVYLGWLGWFPLDERAVESEDFNNYTFGVERAGNDAYQDYKSGPNKEYTHNYGTSTYGTGQFLYRTTDDLFFEFFGDDDVLLYINDKLVVDGGQVQNGGQYFIGLEDEVAPEAEPGVTLAKKLGLENGKIYTFDFYQMERCMKCSAFGIHTNIKVINPSAFPKKKAYTSEGTELAYGAAVKANQNITYEFILENNSTEGMKAVTNLTFKDEQLGVYLINDEQQFSLGNTSIDEITVKKPGETTYSTVSIDELKNLLAIGLQPQQSIAIKGFKYNVGSDTRVINNVVNTTALGAALNSDTSYTIEGSANMIINVADFSPVSFVIDYGKDVHLNKEQIWKNELTLPEDWSAEVSLNYSEGIYGDLTWNENNDTNHATYSLKKFMNGIDKFFFTVDVTAITEKDGNKTEANLAVQKQVNMIPANSIYYEDDFESNSDTTVGIVYTGNWEEDGTKSGNAESVNTPIHGGWQNDSLADDAGYSDGSAHVTSTKGAYASFTFTGTGFDVYSRTNGDVGYVRAQIFKVNGDTKRLVKAIYMDNLSESGDYYQIPTISYDAGYEEYGTYYVKLTAGSKTNDAGGVRGTYYLDGIRIYNPLGSDDSMYDKSEQNAVFTEVRDILIEKKSLDNNSQTVTGAVFIDSLDSNDIADSMDNGITIDDIGTYDTYGPKNEVYLAAGNSIVFAVSQNANYYVGLKSPKGTVTEATVTKGDNITKKTINHSTDLYYKIEQSSGDSAGFIMIQNTGSDLLSITKIKTTNPDSPTEGIMEASLEETLRYANTFSSRKVITDEPENEPENRPENEPENKDNVEITTPNPGDVIHSFLSKLLNRLFNDFEKWFR